ncbi:NAD(P)/FAD-dependent oxidoreductase [Clostridium sp. CS001]|uniref:NAD(P)/FAD-dependent oxidoreductase n=1 Tax=Clostridium sp. CS001 TaxID=2880648 RepID=UPI001CF3E4A8|nr:NAD(P)/FAD-dependent oxidoreductase [Clostridium sp. CS001]MCB2289812.1 NAD(P)/FAD-dependent oxidoreductase [Clostridium sp. CS001]
MYDVIIIGAGIIGASVAREISKYNLKVIVVEKEIDVASGTTKANSAIVHAGFDAEPNTFKGRLNAKGNAMFDRLSKELDFPFKKNGSLVLCFDEADKENLELLKKQGEINGVPGLQILTGEETREMEPNVSKKVVAALFAPTGGIVCPYEMNIAMAENSFINGVEFKFGAKVVDIKKIHDGYSLLINKHESKDVISIIEGKVIINAAGLYSDVINNFISDEKFSILPKKGEYCLFDKAVGNLVTKTIFQLPTKLGKGVLVTPTVDGNLLIGPNAIDVDEKENLDTTKEGLDEIIDKARLSIESIPTNQIITSFSGLRAKNKNDDFIIGEVKNSPGFINVASIDSPGLTSAPAIAEMVATMARDILKATLKENFISTRKGIVRFRELNNVQRDALIKSNPEYGKVVCRCEVVTEGEIKDAIRRPLGAKTIDGVKKRTRTGMGRCQAGFCTSRVVDILSTELNLPKEEITKFGGKSSLVIGKNKDNF